MTGIMVYSCPGIGSEFMQMTPFFSVALFYTVKTIVESILVIPIVIDFQ